MVALWVGAALIGLTFFAIRLMMRELEPGADPVLSGRDDTTIDLLLSADASLGLIALVTVIAVLKHWRSTRSDTENQRRDRIIVLLAYATLLIGAPTSLGGPASLIATIWIGKRDRLRALAGTLTAVVASWAASPLGPGFNPDLNDSVLTLFFGVLMTIVGVVVGLELGTREDVYLSWKREAAATSAEQAARAEQARLEERERISREMHDSLAHRLSLISLHAGALATRTDLGPEQTRRIADQIQSLSADAYAELRSILSVLHDGGEPDASSISWEDVEATIIKEIAAGQDVRFDAHPDWEDHFDSAAPTVRRAIRRLVEEAVTNARRHSPDAPLSVSFTCEQAILTVTCTNPLPFDTHNDPALRESASPGSGIGLDSMRDRVEGVGGTLDVSTHDGLFTLTAMIPL